METNRLHFYVIALHDYSTLLFLRGLVIKKIETFPSSVRANPQERQELTSVLFFVSLLLVNMFFLYVHWLCRRRSAAHADLVSRSQSEQPADCHDGLEAGIIDSFPIILYGSLCDSNDFKYEKESECSICLGVFQNEEKIKMLTRCGHAYHAECVDMWLRTRSSCPLCRASLRVDPLHK